jgi:hypothetical protein
MRDDVKQKLKRLYAEFWQPDKPRTWWHGGAPDLKVGDVLLPAAATGNSAMRSRHDMPDLHLSSLVFIAPDPQMALYYAINYPNQSGTIYNVEPIGTVDITYGQKLLALDLAEAGADFDWMCQLLSAPLKGHNTYICHSAKITVVIGQPHHAQHCEWFHASQLPAPNPSYAEMLAWQTLDKFEATRSQDHMANARRVMKAYADLPSLLPRVRGGNYRPPTSVDQVRFGRA